MRRSGSKLIKRILGVVFIMGISSIFFNGHVGIAEPVHAVSEGPAQENITSTTTTNNQTIDTMSMWQILNIVLKIIYLLLWPLLVIAGLALDNTLVYASIFHLDAPLWQFWNMMKNFANFALGFMVLFAIIKSIFSNSGEGSVKDEKSPLGIIKVTLIAGILIQASWFLVAALVDVSTIATYAVGGLPLSVLKNTNIGDQKILSVNSSIDLNKFNLTFAGGEEFKVWYSTQYSGVAGTDKTVNISPCRVANSYVIGREYGDTGYNNLTKFDPTIFKGQEICVLYGNKLVMWPEKAFFDAWTQAPQPVCTGCSLDDVSGYKTFMASLLGTTGWDANPVVTDKLVYLGSGTNIFDKGNAFFSGATAMTISSLIQKSKGFVGPLVTIYSSLLNFAQLTDTSVSSASGTSGIFIIKSLVAIALFFPLIALALVLILRIGILRLYIVASPFIILKESFKLKVGSLDTYLSFKSVIGIIFAPVVTVAALSISLIFMTALVNGFTDHTTSTDINQTLGIDKVPAGQGNDAVSFGGIVQVEFSKLPWGEAMDWFSRLMVNFFAIGLMWMIFFAALKSNELGKSFGSKVQSFGSNVFQTLPILPIGSGGKGVGISSAANVISNIPNTYINNLNTKGEQQVRDWIDDKTGKENPSTKIGSTTPVIIPQGEVNTFITKDANKTSIEQAIKGRYPTENVGAVLNANTAALYTAINAVPDKAKQNDLAKAVQEASGGTLSDGWFAKATQDAAIATAKTSLDAITKDVLDEYAIKTIFESATNKPIIDTYFKAGATEYPIKAKDTKTYVITPDQTISSTTDRNKIKYTVKIKS